MTETEFLKKHWQGMIERCPLPRDNKPLAIGNVSKTQFSVARYSGGCRYNGTYYIYVPEIDALIRDDFHRWAMKEMKGQRNERP